MIVCSVDESGRIVAMSYFRQVDVAEVKRCLGTMRDLVNQLHPGFLLLTDLTGLDSMQAECAPILGEIMDLCSARGMSGVVRVIPDPAKDIGFGLISQFHLSRDVHVQTHQNLAQAIAALVSEVPPSGEETRQALDEQAEAHFTVAARKEIEENEGGLGEEPPANSNP